MLMKLKLPMLAAAAVLALQSSAFAAPAVVTTDMALRLGPGPTYPVVGVIERNAMVDVMGCIDAGTWCQVSWAGKTGWTFANYLAYQHAGNLVLLPQARSQVQIPTVVYQQQAAAAPVPQIATVGTLPPFNPLQATIEALNPPQPVLTYITTNRVDPIYLDGEIVVGATLPPTVSLYRVPDYQYHYANVNNRVVLVEPGTNRIVYVYR
jgi:uncharacterized protein YraI